jgi:hypothetical protein
MKLISEHYRSGLRTVFPVLILVVLLSGIAISAFHSSHDCGNPDSCAICTFQASSYTSILHEGPVFETNVEPVRLSPLALPDRAPEPFYTSTFASHAPPQSC